MLTAGHKHGDYNSFPDAHADGYLLDTLHYLISTGCSETSCKFLRLVTQSFLDFSQCFGLFYTINYGRFFILVLLGHEIEKKG